MTDQQPGNPYEPQPNPYQQPDPYQQQYQAGPPVPYGQPSPYGPPPQYVVAPPTNTMAILSLVFAFVFSPLAIVFGHMAKNQIKRTGESGDGLATAGLVLGYIFTGITVAFCLCYGVFFAGMCGLGAFAPMVDVTPSAY
jgi:uncharacterized protein DUF4190